MKIKYLLIMMLLSVNCFAQEIILGKNYTQKEIECINTELIPIYEISLENKTIFIYGEKKDGKYFYEEKLLVVKDLKNKIIFSEGIYLMDQDVLFSFYKDEKNCAFKLKNRVDNEAPYNELIVISSDSKQIFRKKIPENFIASLVVLNDNVYYSTEFYENNLKKVNIKTGQYSEIKFTLPNSSLLVIDNLVIGKTIDSKFFYIQDDKIIFFDEVLFEKDRGIKKYSCDQESSK